MTSKLLLNKVGPIYGISSRNGILILPRYGPGILTYDWPKKLLSFHNNIVNINPIAIWFIYKFILTITIKKAIIPPKKPAAIIPKSREFDIMVTAKPARAVINNVPSIDKLTMPTLSEIVSPITANIKGLDIAIIVTNDTSKFSIIQ